MSLLTAYNFYINSRARQRGIPANFSFILEDPITKNGVLPSVFRCMIKSATIPFSFHQFNDYNKTTYFKLVRGGTTYDNLQFSLTNGNYNVNTFATEWKNKVLLAISTASGWIPTITMVYNNDTNHYTIIFSDDGTLSTLTFYNTQGYKQVNLSLGFATEWSVTNVSGDYAESEQAVNVSPSRCLYIQSDSLIQHKSYEAYALDSNSQVRASNVLERIPILVQPNNYINYYNPSPTVNFLANDLIDTLNIQLGDESLDVDLPDFTLNWSLQITIEEWSVDERLVTLNQVPTEEQLRQQLEREQLLNERKLQIQKMEKLKNKLISQ